MSSTLNLAESSFVLIMNDLKRKLDDDAISAYDYWRQLKNMSEHLTFELEEAQKRAYSELSTKPADVLEVMGVSLRKGYAQWDFTQVTYAPYLSAKSKFELAQKELKGVEDTLKTMVMQKSKVMPSGVSDFESPADSSSDTLSLVDENTGECVSITLPSIKGYTKDSIVVKKVS